MMIVEDEYNKSHGEEREDEEDSGMNDDNSLTVKEDEVNDLPLSNGNRTNNDTGKSANRRKQFKPNRLTNDDDAVLQQEEPIISKQTAVDDGDSHRQQSELTNGNQSSPKEYAPSPTNQSRPQQEAYCHLCERSFCNKYFLKTHYAKKHGGLNMVPLLSLTETNGNVNEPSSPPASNPQSISLMTNLQSASANHNPKTSEDYCEICQKHFCNKYYLRKHKGECHGVYTDYIKSLQKSTHDSPIKAAANRPSPSMQIPSSPSNTLLLNPFYPGPSDIKSLFPISASSNNTMKSSISPTPRTIRRCHLCNQEFRNKSLFRMHMNTFHPNEKSKRALASPSSVLPASNLGFLPPFVDTSSQLAQKLATGQTSQASYGILNDSYYSAKMADRVVCEICNKQVCNKYFLKTHKAKVHGITHTEPTEQVHAELDSSDSYCALCKQDFPSKYLYLFHIQTVHNDTADPTYQTLLQFMKTAAAMNENANPFLSLTTSEQFDDETDSNIATLKRKRSASQSSTENKRHNSSTESNAGLQPFLLESEDPKFSHTFVPCMVYLPVVRRVTKQVKINLRLKPVLADASS